MEAPCFWQRILHLHAWSRSEGSLAVGKPEQGRLDCSSRLCSDPEIFRNLAAARTDLMRADHRGRARRVIRHSAKHDEEAAVLRRSRHRDEEAASRLLVLQSVRYLTSCDAASTRPFTVRVNCHRERIWRYKIRQASEKSIPVWVSVADRRTRGGFCVIFALARRSVPESATARRKLSFPARFRSARYL